MQVQKENKLKDRNIRLIPSGKESDTEKTNPYPYGEQKYGGT